MALWCGAVFVPSRARPAAANPARLRAPPPLLTLHPCSRPPPPTSPEPRPIPAWSCLCHRRLCLPRSTLPTTRAPLQVISGLVKFVPEELMAGRRVLVVCNFKPAKMRDVMSYGMVRRGAVPTAAAAAAAEFPACARPMPRWCGAAAVAVRASRVPPPPAAPCQLSSSPRPPTQPPAPLPPAGAVRIQRRPRPGGPCCPSRGGACGRARGVRGVSAERKPVLSSARRRRRRCIPRPLSHPCLHSVVLVTASCVSTLGTVDADPSSAPTHPSPCPRSCCSYAAPPRQLLPSICPPAHPPPPPSPCSYAAPPPEQLNPKKKQWEKIAPEFKTDAGEPYSCCHPSS